MLVLIKYTAAHVNFLVPLLKAFTRVTDTSEQLILRIVN